MLITGYQIRESIKIKHIELESLNGKYEDSLYKFKDEEKESPISIMERVLNLETDIALLQTAQKYYNINTKINVAHDIFAEPLSLEYAIKLHGCYTRYHKKFSGYSKGEKRDRYFGTEPKRRSKEEEYQIHSMSKDEAMNEAIKSQLIVSALSSAISSANSNKLEIPFLNKI